MKRMLWASFIFYFFLSSAVLTQPIAKIEHRDPYKALNAAYNRAEVLLKEPKCKEYFNSLPDWPLKYQPTIHLIFGKLPDQDAAASTYCGFDSKKQEVPPINILISTEAVSLLSTESTALIIIHELAHVAQCSQYPWDKSQIEARDEWLKQHLISEARARKAAKVCGTGN